MLANDVVQIFLFGAHRRGRGGANLWFAWGVPCEAVRMWVSYKLSDFEKPNRYRWPKFPGSGMRNEMRLQDVGLIPPLPSLEALPGVPN